MSFENPKLKILSENVQFLEAFRSNWIEDSCTEENAELLNCFGIVFPASVDEYMCALMSYSGLEFKDRSAVAMSILIAEKLREISSDILYVINHFVMDQEKGKASVS